MSPSARLSRGDAAAPARPARPAASHASVVTTRLRRLAAARSTGTLPFTGGCEGAIYFRDGLVVGAESARTPGAGTPGPGSPGPGSPGPGSPGAQARPAPAAAGQGDLGDLGDLAGEGGTALLPAAGLADALSVEPVVDAVLDLLTSPSGCSRFRSAKGQAASAALALPVDGLLAELSRRRELLRQMSAVVTPDTVVSRVAQIHGRGIQVSALQWALIIRARAGTTPRDLAFELGRSVFGTTAEVYRLMELRLLSLADEPGRPQDPAPLDALERGPTALSFIQAVSRKKSDNPMRQHTGTTSRRDGAS